MTQPICKKKRLQTPLLAQMALRAARELHTRQGRLHVEQSYYYCDPCTAYHLSSWKYSDTSQNGYTPNGGKHHDPSERL